MKIAFSKYHGTGNDFILIDNRDKAFRLTQEEIARLCDRHFGIGADGLMFLTSEPDYDFGMIYYNSDGKESTLCGNGGRCMTAFATSLGLIKQNTKFKATDGAHEALILSQTGSKMIVKLKMSDVPHTPPPAPPQKGRGESGIWYPTSGILLNTGSPHLILFTDHVKELDVVTDGRKYRNDPQFAPDGINVDFVEETEEGLYVRTYERGVENETLSCGTGVTAAALAYASWQLAIGIWQSAVGPEYSGAAGSSQVSDSTGVIASRPNTRETKQSRSGARIEIETPGGRLTVSFRQEKDNFTDIWLEGPVEFVFNGEIDVRET